MNHVWVVMKRWYYEGDELVMVCTTHRVAKSHMRELRVRDKALHMEGWKPSHQYVAIKQEIVKKG